MENYQDIIALLISTGLGSMLKTAGIYVGLGYSGLIAVQPIVEKIASMTETKKDDKIVRKVYKIARFFEVIIPFIPITKGGKIRAAERLIGKAARKIKKYDSTYFVRGIWNH